MFEFKNIVEVNRQRDTIKEEILNAETGTVEVRSYFGQRGTEATVFPVADPKTRWYKGVPIITEAMRGSTEPFVDPLDNEGELSSIVLKHMMPFDLSNKYDKMVLQWLMEHPMLALVYEERRFKPQQLFYLHQEELDTKRRMKNLNLKDDAIAKLAGLTSDDLYRVSRLMGYMKTDSKPDTVRYFIRNLFEGVDGIRQADKFIKALGDPLSAVKEFTYKLIDQGIISRQGKGDYFYGEMFLAANFNRLVERLQRQDQSTTDLLMAMEERLGQTLKSNNTITSDSDFVGTPTQNVDIKSVEEVTQEEMGSVELTEDKTTNVKKPRGRKPQTPPKGK